MNIKDRFIATIQQTGDPLAPIKLQEAYNAIDTIGRLMARIGDKAATTNHSQKLLSAYPDEMEHIARDPSFICALSSLLSSALVAYGANLERE